MRRKFNLKYLLVFLVVAYVLFELFSRIVFGVSAFEYARELLFPTQSFPVQCSGAGCPPYVEEEGKISVSKRPEVVALAERHGWDHVHILAMDIKLVSDLEFIQELRPDFAQELGCVIVVHAGENEGYVYQEDKDLNVVHMETMEEFVASVKDKDPELLFKFFLSLH